jgi:RND superfamily putative drug exporter
MAQKRPATAAKSKMQRLGDFVVRNRWWVIGVWVVVSVAITAFAPKLSSVTNSDQTSFLPS